MISYESKNMAIEEEQLYRKKKEYERTVRRIFVTVSLAFLASTAGIVTFWDQLYGTEKINKKTYQIIHDNNSPILTIYIKNNIASDLRRTHTSAQINEYEQVSEIIKNSCQALYDSGNFSPHRDIFFSSSQIAVNCLHHLRQLQLPDE